MRGIYILLAAGVVAALCAGCDSGGLASGAPTAGTSTGDEEFSILLLRFTSKEQMEQAAWCKKDVENHAGWKGLFVLSDGKTTMLYWGKYLSPKAAAGNLKLAKGWKTSEGLTPFKGAIVAPLPGSDPGPTQWNLKNSPGNYTVVVCIYHDVPEENFVGRKKFAIEACKVLRDKGDEAYFYHGPAQSIVCVGSFPDSSVDEIYQPDHTWMPLYCGNIPQVLSKYPKLIINGRTKPVNVVNDNPADRSKVVEATSYVLRIPGRPELPPHGISTEREMEAASGLKGPNSPEVKEAVRRQKEALKRAADQNQSDENK